MTDPIRLDFVAAMADDCSTRPNAVAYHDAATKAAERATDPKACRPGSPAVGYAYDEAARHWLSALLVTLPPSTTTAERLLAAAILAARCEGRDLPIDRASFQHFPEIKELQDYAAQAPAIVCGEGYWDDMETANADGSREEQSGAADMIRKALRALGLNAPAGVAVCPDCFCEQEGPHACHSSQCELDEAEEHEAEELLAHGEPGGLGADDEQLTETHGDPLRGLLLDAPSCNRNGHHRGPCSHRCNPTIPARA